MSLEQSIARRCAGRSQLRPVLRILGRTAVVFAVVGAIDVALGRATAVLMVQALVLVWLWMHLGGALRNPRQRIVLAGIRPLHFALALQVLAGVLLAVVILLAPRTRLRSGWWEYLGGTGNVIFGAASNRSGWISRLVLPGLILIPLRLSLCRFALREERAFRRGDATRGIGARLWRSLMFGLAHLVMGIPIGAALGRGVGGFGFSQVSLRRWRKSGSRLRSVLESARVHFAYNLILVSLVAVMLIGTAVASR